ncbi:MAG: hypothetical protein AB8G86_26495 [Saprospiraceae bacterium]
MHPYPFAIELALDSASPLPAPEICGNNQDDDNDGLVDNYDDDCCAHLSIIPQTNYTLHYADSEQPNYGEATNATDCIWGLKQYKSMSQKPLFLAC